MANLIVFFIYGYLFNQQNSIENGVLLSYLIDCSIGLIFTGIIGYNILKINQISLNKVHRDIEMRLQAENALKESERKYREMLELLPQTVFESDLRGKLTYVNRHGFQLFGYDQSDLDKGVNVLDTVVVEEYDRAKENISKLIRGHKTKGNSYTAIRKDRSTFKVEIYTDLIHEKDIPIGIRGVIVDMTAHIEAEKQIKESRDQFEALVNNIPGVTYRCLYDSLFTIAYISSEIETLSGYSASAFINNQQQSYSSIIFDDEKQWIFDQKRQAVLNDKPWELEYRIIHKDGSVRWVYEKGRVIKSLKGNIDFIDGFILDITDRKTAEQLLAQSEARFKTVIDLLPYPVMLNDLQERYLIVNDAFCKEAAVTKDEVIGKKIG
jgi:PAS domain S-box-containing protein